MKKKKLKKQNKTKIKVKPKKVPVKNKFGTQEGVLCLVDNITLDDYDEENFTALSEIQIFPSTQSAGEIYHPSQDEPLKLDQDFFDGMIKSFDDSGIHVMVDYNHASGMALSEADGRAAGFIVALSSKEDGLYGTVEWNERGLASIEKREYKYLSPEWSTHQYDKHSGEVVDQGRLFAVALTNRPYLEGTIAPLAATDNLEEGIETMEDVKVSESSEANTSEVNEDAEAAATTKEEKETIKQDTDALLAAEQARSHAAIIALKEVQKEQREALIETAMSEGRVTPAMLPSVQGYSETLGEANLNDGGISDLRGLLKNLPVQTFNKEVGGHVVQNDDVGVDISDTDKIIAQRLGITTDLMQRFGGVRGLTSDRKLVLEDGTLRDLK